MSTRLPLEDEANAELMAQSAAGDRGAFDRLAVTHLPRLYRIAARVLGEGAEAEDAAQAAMLHAWRRAARFDPERGTVSAWLNRIALNQAIDGLRRTPAPDRITDDLPDPSADITTGIERRQRRQALAAGIRTLPARQRAAVLLTYMEEMAGAEAARTLGVSARALEGLLHRARRSLRTWLQAREV